MRTRNTVLRMVLAIVCAFGSAGLAAAVFVPLAAAERGMTGQAGGEWLLVLAVFIGVLWAMVPREEEE